MRFVMSPAGRLAVLLALALLFAPFAPALAQDNAANEDVIQRYEQILERAPVEGPSFDKLLQIYQDGEGLEKLDARWTPLSTQPGAKGATYSLLRGLLADRMAKTDDARRLLRSATQAQPGDYHGWLALGDFESREGHWPDAIAALQKGLATNVTGEDRLSLYRKLGQAQERSLDVTSALATWQTMVGEFPKDQFALDEAGAAELDANQFDEARKTFQKLVDLTEPNSMNRVQALMKLAGVDDRQGKTDDAVHDYENILPLTADSSWLNREIRAQIEQVYRRQDDLAGLVAYYLKWTGDHPQDVDALLLLAATQTELGRTGDALDTLRKVTVIAPDRHEVRESFAEALVQAKQYDEAITVLTALTAADPTEPRYWATMGDAIWHKTQPPTAQSRKAVLDAWNNIAPADTKDVAAIIEVADLCHDHGMNDEALTGYQRALALTPDASDIREKAVKLLVEMDRKDDAWKLLDAMADGNLATAANELKLAGLDLEFERNAAAADAVRKGLALDPNNFDLLSQQWTLLANDQKWADCVALYGKLIAAAPNPYFIDEIEARHVQALGSAGLLDATEKSLREKLGATPGLGEGDLRLLLRIMTQAANPDVPKVIDEARRRFPQSTSLARLEIDYERHQGNYDGAITALQNLIQTAPLQKTDWLTEIVHVRRDQGNLDAALQSADQLIAASPAGADGYLLYAEIAIAAGKPDQAVAKLEAAIKLSDKPNDVRLRLARYYLDSGQPGKARGVYDEAFEAADSPQDKLAIVRAMTPAYFQAGQVEELVARFKKEQSSEENGWRYGLYLAAIYEEMDDFGQAREELAKSLAVRPQDTGLLHSLIGLSEKEGDFAELLKYREALAQADPSATNELDLANEYASQGKSEEAWHVVQKNLAEVAKDPLAWKDVLSQISDPDYAAKIKDVLETAIRTKGGTFEGEYALAQFQIEQGDLDAAQKTLWDILAKPLPSAPPNPPASANPAMNPAYGGFLAGQGPLGQRLSQSYLALNEAQQLLMMAQNRGQAQMQMQMRLRLAMFRGGQFGQPGVTTTLDPAAIRDRALVFLTLMALQHQQTDSFLKDLEARIDAWHWPISEKILAYASIQAREPLMAAIEWQAKSGTPDPDLDTFCYGLCDDFLTQDQSGDDSFHSRAQAAQALLETRLDKNPAFAMTAAARHVNELVGDDSPAGRTKLEAAVDAYLKFVDPKDPEQLIGAIGVCAQAGDFSQGKNWAQLRQMIDELAATDRSKWSVTTTQQVTYMPMGLLQQANGPSGPAAKEIIPVLMQLIRLGYPTSPPPVQMASSPQPGMRFQGGFYGGTALNLGSTFPPPNRYFALDRIGALEPMFQQLKARKMLPDMYAALDQEEKSLTDWRKIYPQLLRVYFEWWDGKRDDSIASVRKLIDADPSDDHRQLLASMLVQEEKYDDALPVLESITARYGPAYIATQAQILHVARLAKNDDAGQKAGLRLIALRLPQQELMQILDDLRNVGLKDQADAVLKKQSASGPSAVFTRTMQAGNQTLEQLERAANEGGNETLATNLARQALSHDPLSASPYGNETYIRSLALNVLKKYGQLDSYVADLEQQLKATPDSVRLNWLAGEACQAMDDHVEKTFGLAPGPQWLRIVRTGKKLEGFYSLNGADWVSAGTTIVDLPPRVQAGFWIEAGPGSAPAQATATKIELAGKFSASDATAASAPVPAAPSTNSASATPPPPAPAVTTNAVTTNAAPTPPAAPPSAAPAWQQSEITASSAPTPTPPGPDGARTLSAAPDKGPIFTYEALDGDGSITACFDHITGPMGGRNSGAGLMIRESLVPGSRAVRVGVNPDTGIDWQARHRAIPGNLGPVAAEMRGWSLRPSAEIAGPIWFKLARKGDTFTGSTSIDGKAWTETFSRDVTMGPDARVGLISTTDGNTSLPAMWSSIQVTSAATAAPAPAPASASTPTGGLPAPWEFIEIGQPTTHGSAQWKDSLMLSPAGPFNSPAGRSNAFVFQTLHGDGEIVAHLDRVDDFHSTRRDGLSFRSRLDASAPEVQFFATNDRRTGYYYTVNASERALGYFKRVAELDPRNTAVLVNAAAQLQRSNKPGDAADLYAQILKSDFAAGMGQAQLVLQAFMQANRLPLLLQIIHDWNPPPLNPMGGGFGDVYFPLVQLAGTLRQGGQLPEAEQVYRKALSIDTYQNKQDAASSLVQVLIDEDRRDDAGAELEKWVMNSGAPAPAPAQPVFAFNFRSQQTINSNWLQFMGTNQNGIVIAPVLHFLELAADLGLAPKLRQELLARADKNRIPTNGQLDPDRVAAALLAIDARDPAYRPMVEKMLKDAPPGTIVMGNNINALLILSQQLDKWPEERPMALRLASAVLNSQGATQNPYFKNIAAFQVLRIARAMGDHKTTQATLRDIAANMHQQHAANPGQMPIEQLLLVASGMIDEGMLKEAGDLLADAKGSPQFAGNNYFQQKIAQVQAELDFARGEPGPIALNYGLQTTPGKHGDHTRIFWQINALLTKQNNGRYNARAPWHDTTAARPTTWSLELSGGPDEDQLKVFASWDHVATQGSELITLPPGVNVVQAALVHAKTGTSTPAQGTPPLTDAADASDPVESHLLLIGGPNLLKNPDFTATKSASGQDEIAGWHGVPTSSVSHDTGGPLPSGGFESIDAGTGMFGSGSSEITGDRIPIDPAASYVLSAWVRQQVGVGLRFLDADGKMLRNDNLGFDNNNDDRWTWCAFKFGPRGEVSIPPTAAFIEFAFRPNQDFSLAGLTFQLWPAPAAPAPKPPMHP